MDNHYRISPKSQQFTTVWTIRLPLAVITILSLCVAPNFGSAAEDPKEPRHITSQQSKSQDSGRITESFVRDGTISSQRQIGTRQAKQSKRIKRSRRSVPASNRRPVQKDEVTQNQSPPLPLAYQRRLARHTETPIEFDGLEAGDDPTLLNERRRPVETNSRAHQLHERTSPDSARRPRHTRPNAIGQKTILPSKIRRLFHADRSAVNKYHNHSVASAYEYYAEGNPEIQDDSGIDLDNPGSECESGNCGSLNCGSCCSSSHRLDVRAEALLWWTNGFDTPPLVTTGPGSVQETAGVLGQDGTVILFGDDSLNDGMRPGARFAMTKWFGPCWALEAEYTYLGRESEAFSVSSGGDPVLARPYRNAQNGQEEAGLTAFTDVVQGSLSIDSATDLDIFDIVVRRALTRHCGQQIDLILGYRHAELDERLAFRDINQSLIDDSTLDIHDSFDTRNQFHGGEIGLAVETTRCGWAAELLMKVALGNSESRVNINGMTTKTVSSIASEDDGGFLALSTNSGTFKDDHFAVIPELSLRLSRQLCCGWSASVGYTFLYWAQVARPGDPIDRDLNPSLFPPSDLTGAPLPEFRLTPSDFWAQGLNFGLECCW